jgi:hypothetical protein
MTAMEEPPSSAAQTAPATENGPSDPSKQQQPEQQENHENPQKPNPNATPGSRSQIPRRDRFNHQSLGPALNSTVKQVRHWVLLSPNQPTTTGINARKPPRKYSPRRENNTSRMKAEWSELLLTTGKL